MGDAADAVKSEDTASEDTASDAAVKATPARRPRSAASRARRIGGAAATPRPDTDAAETAGKTPGARKPSVDIGKKPAGKRAGSLTEPDTKPETKSTGKSTGKAGAKSTRVSTTKGGRPARSTAGGDADKADKADKAASATVTFAVPGWLRWVPGFVFAATAVVFLTLFAVSRIGGDDSPSSTSAPMRQEVLAAAKTCLATLNTYRYDQIDAAEKAGVACTTGKLTSDYKRTVSTVIRKNAPPLKAVQLAKINAAGIESVTKNGEQWTILAYGQLNITTSNTGKQGRVDPFAVVARLEKIKGKWLLVKIDTVSSFSG